MQRSQVQIFAPSLGFYFCNLFTLIHNFGPNSFCRPRPKFFHEFSETALLSKLRNSLVVLQRDVVWIMEDASFTKLYTICIPDQSVRTTVVGFRKTGEPVIEYVATLEWLWNAFIFCVCLHGNATSA
ncbi:hypothetical protein Hanom_Chr02g00171031 [Helianthus anomalus]